jgi:hypothetical protein
LFNNFLILSFFWSSNYRLIYSATFTIKVNAKKSVKEDALSLTAYYFVAVGFLANIGATNLW